MKFPIEVEKINIRESSSMYPIGESVRVKPCDAEYKGKTYTGILLGALPKRAMVSYDRMTKELHISPDMNPAIYVPEIQKIIWGEESWWDFSDTSKMDEDVKGGGQNDH